MAFITPFLLLCLYIFQPIIIREAPPQIPEPTRRVIHVPGKVVQAPARKVVVERLPCAPPKPQQVNKEF